MGISNNTGNQLDYSQIYLLTTISTTKENGHDMITDSVGVMLMGHSPHCRRFKKCISAAQNGEGDAHM